MHDLATTLVGVATPPGRGGVGCLRLSGPDAVRIARQLFRPAVDGSEARAGGPPAFGQFLTRDGDALDRGYLVVFRSRSAFTGEPTAELWSHGSPAVLAELLAAAVAAGATPSSPGEFTYRALRHGRLDLARAEALRDLVEARTVYQARVARAQVDGSLSRRLSPLRELLEDAIARTEAAVEFVDESDVHQPPGRLVATLEHGIGLCTALLAGFESGRIVREGATVALVGLPNVGKSSLFNRLLSDDRAIVTEVPGTTRDTLAETIDIAGVPVRLLDTAGLRQSEDPIEREGVRRTLIARQEADLVLLVLDATRPLAPLERAEIGSEARGSTVIVLNKCDVARGIEMLPPQKVMEVSALTGAGIEELRRELGRRWSAVDGGDAVLTNARHASCLVRARATLVAAAAAARQGWPEECILEDLAAARGHLGEITGEFGDAQLYERIFSTFCIGK